MDSSDIVDIVAIVVSGVVGPSIGALWAWKARTREEERLVRENQLAVLETALNNLTRGRHALSMGMAAWSSGVPFRDPRAQQLEQALGDTLDPVWASNDQIRIRFGHDAPVTASFEKLLEAFETAQREIGCCDGPARWRY